MLKRFGKFSGLSLHYALAALCVAVICLGVHSKLSLYSAPTSQSVETIAKFSTEKNSSQTMASIRQGLEEPSSWMVAGLLCFAIALPSVPAPSLSVDQNGAICCHSGGRHWQGPDVMRRPPPPTLA